MRLRVCLSAAQLILLITVGLFSLGGCGKSIVGHPVMLETRAFPIPEVGGFATYDPYQYSRLEKGNGLYLFTYDIRRIRDTIAGLRIWEHQFKNGESEVYVSAGDIPVEGTGAKLNGLVWFFAEEIAKAIDGVEKHIDLEFIMTYHRGKVVYGGRLVLTPVERGVDVQVEQHFDEDTAPILKYFRGQLKPEEILRIPMRQRYVPIRR